MKKMLLLLLVATPLRFGLGMEASMNVEESQTSLSPFYITDLRLLITEQLCRQCSMEKALTTIKAWAMTDTKAWALFQTKEAADLFIKWFYTRSYLYTIDISLLEKLKVLLNQEELATFNQSLEKGAELVELFAMCSTSQDWNTCLTQLTTLQEASISKYLAGYYWESSYMDSYAQKNLLCYALELQAPQEVIQVLIDWGSCLTPLKATTPSPCLFVCQNIVNTLARYEKIHDLLSTMQNLYQEASIISMNLPAQNQANESFRLFSKGFALTLLKEKNEEIASLKKEHNETLKGLKETLTMLIEKKGNINSGFMVPNQNRNRITPLLVAARAHNLDLIQYLLEQGACVSRFSFPPILSEFFQNKIPFFIIEALVSKVSSTDVHFLTCLTAHWGIQSPKPEEEACCKVLALFLNHTDSAINTVENGFTLLDIVYQRGKNNSKIGLLLTEYGALLAEKDENTQLVANLTYKTHAMKTIEGRAPLLQEVKNVLLSNPELKITEALIFVWSRIALMVCLTDPHFNQEAKEFLKCIALRFPHIPLFRLLTKHMYTIKLDLRNQHAVYLPYLKKVQDLILWLGKEGIKDISKPQARNYAKEWGLYELVDSLTSVLPD